MLYVIMLFFFFFNDTATTEIYTLSLHDALPICLRRLLQECRNTRGRAEVSGNPADIGILDTPPDALKGSRQDRKSTRLNSSHSQISYAVFCLKKKKKN